MSRRAEPMIWVPTRQATDVHCLALIGSKVSWAIRQVGCPA